MLLCIRTVFLVTLLSSVYGLCMGQQKIKFKDRTIDLKLEKGTRTQYLQILLNQGIPLAYSSDQLTLNKLIEIKSGTYSVENLLSEIFKPNVIYIDEQNSKLVVTVTTRDIEYSIDGFVIDIDSKEILPGASMIITDGKSFRTKTDDYGHYSFSSKTKTVYITTYYTGYSPQIDTIYIKQKNTRQNIFLKSVFDTIDMVEVKLPKEKHERWNGQKSIALKHINDQGGLLGNKDLYNILKHEPGVISGNPGSGEWLIRGGNADQNLVLLDGIPVYSYSHIFGLSSIFNSDILKNADFYKGSFPARYDGRLSSVIDVKTKDGNMHEYQGVANFGILNGSLMFEGPIVKEKSSFIISGRRSWFDLISNSILNKENRNKTFMTDLNIKLNHIINPKNRIFISTYYGEDNIKVPDSMANSSSSVGWKNKLLSLRWFSIHHPKITHNSTLVLSEFLNNSNIEDDKLNKWKLYNKIIDIGFDNEMKLYPNNFVTSMIGFKIHKQFFTSPINKTMIDPQYNDITKLNSIHLNAYIDNDVEISKQFHMRAGLHFTKFIVDDKAYNTFQPRTSLSYSINNHHSFYTGYATMVQFYNQISLGGISIPMDFRMPSTKDIPPQQSISYEIGYEMRNIVIDRMTVQLYEKNYKNVLRYRPFQSILGERLAPYHLDRIISGIGKSRGIEISFDHKFQKLYAVLSYSLSESEFTYPTINDGKPFPSQNDLRHVGSGYVTYNFNKKWKIGFNGRISSGRWINTPLYNIPLIEDILGDGSIESNDFQITTFNSHRLPYNYDLNFNTSKTSYFKKNRKGTLSFGINNVTNRATPIFTYVSGKVDELKSASILPFRYVPHLSYSYEF